MGMAATQARFLGLTARKTNIEFEGQQINQQRTSLSNESASYYSRLTNLSVPTPPSTQDYSKVTYTFTDGSETNTINQLIATRNISGGKGYYIVNYTQSVKADSIVSNGTVIVSKNVKDKIDEARKLGEDDPNDEYLNTLSAEAKAVLLAAEKERLNYLNKQSGTDDWYVKYQPDSEGAYKPTYYRKDEIEGGTAYRIGSTELRTLGTYNESDYYLSTLSPKERENAIAMERQYLQILKDKYNEDKWYVRYQKDSSTGTYNPTFFSANSIEKADYSESTNASLSTIKAYVWGETVEAHEIKNAKARTEQDSSGRYINITIYDTDEDGNVLLGSNGEELGRTYQLISTTSTDDNAYNDAMNQYNYDKALYDQEIQKINSKIEIIQGQDKNLELKLKQLDTERQAIVTEADALSKVISKNIGDTFKSFQG